MGGLFSKKTDESPSLVINTLAVDVELRFLLFDSPRKFTGSLLEMNQEEVKIILDCKKDNWKNKELFELVDEYFKNSLQTLDICTSLEKCLKKAHAALEEEDGGMDGQKYLRTLEELKNLYEFFKAFGSVYKHQVMMRNKLLLRERKLDKKLKSVKAWRKVSGIIFAAAFAAFLICLVVTAAVAAPPVASALAAATSIPLGSMGKWVDSRWKNYVDALKGRKKVLSSMQGGTCIVLKDLENIQVPVGRSEEIKCLPQTVDFALTEEAVKFGIEEIKKKLGVFMQSIDDLSEHIDKCSQDVRRAGAVVLERITKHPNE